MANPDLHRKDTENAIQGTTSNENIMLIVDIVDFCVDGQWADKSLTALDRIIRNLEVYGINVNTLYQDFMDQGVDPNEIEKKEYKNDKMEFLCWWFLPPHSAMHQMYTHKGADYDYSKESDGSGEWKAVEIEHSWKVKRKLLINSIEKVFDLPSVEAERAAMTLYSIHRLRDLKYNGTSEESKLKDYFVNIVDDLRKYTLPLIQGYNSFYKEIEENIAALAKNIEVTKQTKSWKELWLVIDVLLGEDFGSGGILSKVIPGYLRV